MTRRTFYRQLRKVARQFKWKLEYGVNIRGSKDNKIFCPITALTYAKHLGSYPPCLLQSGGQKLGMKYDDYNGIANGADDFKTKPHVRKALLKAVGLV